jgi:hypothetical protein
MCRIKLKQRGIVLVHLAYLHLDQTRIIGRIGRVAARPLLSDHCVIEPIYKLGAMRKLILLTVLSLATRLYILQNSIF